MSIWGKEIFVFPKKNWMEINIKVRKVNTLLSVLFDVVWYSMLIEQTLINFCDSNFSNKTLIFLLSLQISQKDRQEKSLKFAFWISFFFYQESITKIFLIIKKKWVKEWESDIRYRKKFQKLVQQKSWITWI